MALDLDQANPVCWYFTQALIVYNLTSWFEIFQNQRTSNTNDSVFWSKWL
jgi:hypothetical protein